MAVLRMSACHNRDSARQHLLVVEFRFEDRESDLVDILALPQAPSPSATPDGFHRDTDAAAPGKSSPDATSSLDAACHPWLPWIVCEQQKPRP